jgi:5-methylcytosine-specific restriction endonuclease McrA
MDKRNLLGQFQKGFKHSEATKVKMLGRKSWISGKKIDKDKYPNYGHHKPHTEKTKKLISEKKKANPTRYWLGKKRPHWHQSIETRRKLSESHKGEKSYLWQGGKTKKNLAIRKSFEYKIWRVSVFERDEYTCQVCMEVGGKLHAHHIKSFAHYPELRFDINNGITLCVDCHKLTDNYMGKSNRKE